jgi:hypothetical protein
MSVFYFPRYLHSDVDRLFLSQHKFVCWDPHTQWAQMDPFWYSDPLLCEFRMEFTKVHTQTMGVYINEILLISNFKDLYMKWSE